MITLGIGLYLPAGQPAGAERPVAEIDDGDFVLRVLR